MWGGHETDSLSAFRTSDQPPRLMVVMFGASSAGDAVDSQPLPGLEA